LPHPHRLDSFRGRQPCPTRPRLMPPARGPTGRHTSSADLTSHFIFPLYVYRPGGRLNHELCKRGKPSTTAQAQRTTGQAALGPDHREPAIRLTSPAYLTGAQQQTPPISTPTWREQWIQNKVRENQPRPLAPHQGRQPTKPPCRNAVPRRCGADELAATHNTGWYFSDLRGSAADNATHGEGENHLMGGATRAEAIDYLSHAYGPVFVGVLIKHLPNPRRCWAS
jgi:hypothetical protein